MKKILNKAVSLLMALVVLASLSPAIGAAEGDTYLLEPFSLTPEMVVPEAFAPSSGEADGQASVAAVEDFTLVSDPTYIDLSDTPTMEQAPDTSLSAKLAADAAIYAVGDTIRFTGSAEGGAAPYAAAQLALFWNDQPLLTIEGYVAEVTAEQAGRYHATLTVTDAAGHTATALAEVQCADGVTMDIATLAPSFQRSGDAGQDMAALARSQVGYSESATDLYQDAQGTHAASKYGQWYDLVYSGGEQSPDIVYGPWNAAFVSYCAYYAGANLPASNRTEALLDAIRARGLFAGRDTLASIGDVIFLDLDGDGAAEQSGIITETDGSVYWVVEGDVHGTVLSRSYGVAAVQIIGFARVSAEIQLMPDDAFSAETILGDILSVTTQQGATTGDVLDIDDSDSASGESDASSIAVEGLRIEQVTVDSAQVALGDAIRWTVGAVNGQGVLRYQYTVKRNDEQVESQSSVENAFSYTPTAAGSYVLYVEVRDDSGSVATSEGSEAIAVEPLPEEPDEPATMPYTLSYQGGTVERSEALRFENPGGITLYRALLSELTVAYLTCSTSTLELGKPVTWTVHAEGGDGKYQYQIGLYHQDFSASITDLVYKVTSQAYSSKNTFTYTPTASGRYVLLIYVRDDQGQYIYWESPVYLTSEASETSDPETVAGKVQWVIAQTITAGMTDREKALALHDWLINNADYDYSYTHYHADGVLLYGTGVCQSYAQAYMMLCQEVGIPNIFVTGVAGNVAHAWNLIRIDGQWLHVDCTWDDRGGTLPPSRSYFCITEEQIKRDHSWNSDVTDASKRKIDGIYPVDTVISATAIALDASAISLDVGQTRTMKAAFTPSNATDQRITWSSGNLSVATVDIYGTITAVSAGTATITATTTGQLKAYVVVTVQKAQVELTAIALDRTGTVQLPLGQSLTLNAVLTPATAVTSLTWSSSASTVAAVSQQGVVTPLSAGNATITVTAANGLSASVRVQVTDPSTPTSITLNRTGTIEMNTGATLTLQATMQPSTAVSDLTWQSSNTAVATVSSRGVVTSRAVGTATITVTTATGNLSASVRIQVVDPTLPTGIALNQTGTVGMTIGTPLSLVATLSPSGAQSELYWHSSSPAVATVSTSGVVTPVGIGASTITVTAIRSNVSAQVTVQVSEAIIAPTGVTLNHSGTVDMLTNETLALVATLTPAGAQSDLTWRSSNSTVATVSGSGVVTSLQAGTATITVTATRSGVTASVTVRVSSPVIDPTGITLNLSGMGTIDIEPGRSTEMTVTMTPSGATSPLTWQSSNENVIRVDEDGVAYAVAQGTATVTVTATSTGVSDAVTFRVSPLPTRVSLNRTGTVEMTTASSPLQLTATLLPSGAYSELAWSSSNASVASVSDGGLVTPQGIGTATITVTALRGGAGHSASVTVNVSDPTPVPTSVTLNHSDSVDMLLSETLQLTAALQPSGAQSALTWASSNTGVATVSDTGLVTPVAVGRATITVTTVRGNRTASVLITVSSHGEEEPPTSVTLDRTGTVTLDLKGTLTLKATLAPSTATSPLAWTSSAPSVASVDAAGTVTPHAEGTTTITVTATNGNKSASVRVQVVDGTKPTGVSLDKTGTIDAAIGTTLALKATVTPAGTYSELTWTSSAPTIASVDANGRVTPLRTGTTTITVTAVRAGVSATVQVRVSNPVRPTGISLNYTGTVELSIDQKLALAATLSPAGAQSELQWRSSSSAIATVDATGVVTPVKEGTATITVTALDGNRSASVRVRVVNPNKPTGVVLDHSGQVDLDIRQTLKLTATLVPATAQSALTWTSSNQTIATVDGSGLVTPVKEGTATITVRTADGNRTATVRVRIVNGNKPTGVSLNRTGQVDLSLNETLALQATLSPSTSYSTLSWRSSSTRIATVDANGVVTPIREGTVTITVTANDARRSASVRVRVIDPYKPTGIALNWGGTVDVSTNDTLALQARLTPASAQSALAWRSSATSIATVDENGVVTPLREGTTTITVTAEKTRRSASVRVRVSDPYKPTGIQLNLTGTVELALGNTLAVQASLIPSSARAEITWRSSSAAVATVDASGVVTPIREGRVTITATETKTRRTARVIVQVIDPVKATAVSISAGGTALANNATQALRVGETLSLNAVLTPATATSGVTWRSVSGAIASVDQSGLVTANRAGRTTIIATTSSNKTARIVINVTN